MAMIQIWQHPPDQYLTLIGHFIVSMNHQEAYLKQLLWKVASLGHELGALMTGGSPIKDISWLLRKIFDKHSDNQLVVDDIESILEEVSSLKLARDQVAHRQWHSNALGTILSNRALAKTAESVEETPYNLDELEALCIRAVVLNGRILRHLIDPAAIDVIERNWNGQYELPLAAWRGKSMSRDHMAERHRKARKPSHKQARQRRSSRA